MTLSESTGSTAIHVGWYTGDVETDRLTINQIASCSLDEFPVRATALDEAGVLIVKAKHKT